MRLGLWPETVDLATVSLPISWSAGPYIDTMCMKMFPTTIVVCGCIKHVNILEAHNRPTMVHISLDLMRYSDKESAMLLAGRTLQDFTVSTHVSNAVSDKYLSLPSIN